AAARGTTVRLAEGAAGAAAGRATVGLTTVGFGCGLGVVAVASCGGRMVWELGAADAVPQAPTTVITPNDAENATTTERHRSPVVSGMNPFPA
ncbi:MAG: hypothetical protein KIT36_21460, partial [Alphaproteobacteria bacterium]|nr:hypothetical protein [Alphaproteobacteria bacterium]